MAAQRRIHHVGRQLQRDPLRARHTHFRNLHPQYFGYRRHSRNPEALASAHPGRPFAWHGPARQGCAPGPRGDRRWCRWFAAGSPQRPRTRPLRRRAIASFRAVRRTDDAIAHDRPRRRPQYRRVMAAPFSRVAVLGTGLIGGSFALAVRKAFPAIRIIGWDKPSVLERALELRVVQDAKPELTEALAGVELVYIALPV